MTRRRDGREREDANWLAELLIEAAFWLACIVLRLDRAESPNSLGGK